MTLPHIEKLRLDHDTEGFDCGQSELSVVALKILAMKRLIERLNKD